jgi:hypothetical protein
MSQSGFAEEEWGKNDAKRGEAKSKEQRARGKGQGAKGEEPRVD